MNNFCLSSQRLMVDTQILWNVLKDSWRFFSISWSGWRFTIRTRNEKGKCSEREMTQDRFWRTDKLRCPPRLGTLGMTATLTRGRCQVIRVSLTCWVWVVGRHSPLPALYHSLKEPPSPSFSSDRGWECVGSSGSQIGSPASSPVQPEWPTHCFRSWPWLPSISLSPVLTSLPNLGS